MPLDAERGISKAAIFLNLPRTVTDKISCLGGKPVALNEELEIGKKLRTELHALQDPIVERRSESYTTIATAQQGNAAQVETRPR